MKGLPGRYFALGATSKKRGFYATHPVYDPAGKIVGLAAIKNPLILFQQGLQQSDPAFLIDPTGVIFLSSRPNLDSQSLWPVRPLDEVEKLQFGTDQVKPVFSRVLTDGAEVKVEDRPFLFYRQYISAPGASGWSLVLLTPNNLVVFYRFLGIAGTFIFALFTLLAAGSNLSIREGAQRLVTSEARFRAMFDAAPEAVMVYDHETRQIVDANPFMAQWLGYSPEELLNLKIDQVLVAESWKEEGRGQGAAGLPSTYCQRYRKKDGSLVEVECTAANLPYGDRGRELVIIRDVTERRRAEEALRESEARFRTLFENMSEGVALHEVIYQDDGQAVDYRIISTNPAFEKHTGLKPEQVQGQLASSAYGTGTAPYLETYARVARSGQPLVFETYSPSIKRHFHISITSPKPGQFVTVFEDITEQRQAEAERLRFSKLESVATLAGGIAHDFNNILTAIMGNISLAMLDQPETGPGRERLTAAERACSQAQSLARQLLTFATGGVPIKELLSLEKFIRETVSFAASGSPVRCEFRFPDNLWAAEADPNQISQVFQNLVINAIQAMSAGGIITMRGENLEVGEGSDLPLEAGRYVQITIQDQGIGIPADFLPKIFDPYFTTKQAGSGLGLATVYSIMNRHRGHIAVESKLGEGTTFKIYLPAREGETIPRTEVDPQVLSGRGKILVMDDEELVRDLLKVMLGRLGYQVILAKNGEAAIDLFAGARDAGENFAAVILDLTVSGGMGGKAAIQQLLKLDPGVKAIVSSGYSDDPVMADFEKYGFSDVITKPYRIAELSRVLNRVLNVSSTPPLKENSPQAPERIPSLHGGSQRLASPPNAIQPHYSQLISTYWAHCSCNSGGGGTAKASHRTKWVISCTIMPLRKSASDKKMVWVGAS
jgi:PAS domain S-box-containing protein